jgi:hypothetical protein
MVARSGGDEDLALLDRYPDGFSRADAALRNPNAGEVLVSAAPGWEFVDLAGSHHVGGGSHGSLRVEDSLVPLVTAGFAPGEAFPTQPSITDIQPFVCRHFGVPRVSRPHALATTVG